MNWSQDLHHLLYIVIRSISLTQTNGILVIVNVMEKEKEKQNKTKIR